MKKIFIIAVLFAAVVLAGWGILHISSGMSADTAPQTLGATSLELHSGIGKTSGRPVPSDAAEYYNPYYHLSLLYPSFLKVGEHAEAGNAITLTFEDIQPKTIQGFQVFIVPFSGSQITEERFKEDNPSGVRNNLKNISVDGATGASFYSNDYILGDTYEVWFLRNGYLYEVNTFKESAAWLDAIVQTWKFIE
jgi:hypothetical protein